MCGDCVLAGNLTSAEVSERPVEHGYMTQYLLFRVGDTAFIVQEDLEGPVEFAAAALQGIEFFEDLKGWIFESTQFNSEQLR